MSYGAEVCGQAERKDLAKNPGRGIERHSQDNKIDNSKFNQKY